MRGRCYLQLFVASVSGDNAYWEDGVAVDLAPSVQVGGNNFGCDKYVSTCGFRCDDSFLGDLA